MIDPKELDEIEQKLRGLYDHVANKQLALRLVAEIRRLRLQFHTPAFDEGDGSYKP